MEINIFQYYYSYYLNYTMNKIPKPAIYQRHSTHNSQLYEKLLQDQHFLSQVSQRQSPSHAQLPMREEQQQVQMVIEFGGSSSASLMVGSNDDPLTLAKRFCFKYNIDPRIISTLASNIKNLQLTTFHNSKDSVYKVERNNESQFDDKQNKNQLNYSANHLFKSHQKTLSSSKIKKSRNLPQSSHNDSAVISTSKSGAGVSTNRYTVFQRLYQDSRKKTFNQLANQTTKRNQSRLSLNNSNPNNRSLNQSSINVCLSIYQKNTRLKQQSRQHIEHLQELKKQKQVQSCKFKPTINPLSNMIANKLRELDQSNLINKSGNDRQMLKIKEYLLKREQEEMKQCTFKPKVITKISTQNSKYSTERFLQLHEDHHFRQTKRKLKSQEKLKQAEKEHHPSINKLSKIIVNKDFFQRLEEDKAKRINKKESLQKIKNQKNTDGRPSTGRPPANRNLGEKTIGQYLYEKARESRALTIKQQPKIFTDPKSSHIYSQSKKCAFEYLFDLLDSDQDGLVSSTKINITGLGEEILRLLAPLLSEMEEVQVELNQHQFYQAFGRLYSTFSVEEKNTILKFYKNKGNNSKISENPSFQPTLNEKSLMIARQLCGEQGDIYDNSVIRMKQKQNKLNRLRAERMLVEYNQCTFHPNLRY